MRGFWAFSKGSHSQGGAWGMGLSGRPPGSRLQEIPKGLQYHSLTRVIENYLETMQYYSIVVSRKMPVTRNPAPTSFEIAAPNGTIFSTKIIIEKTPINGRLIVPTVNSPAIRAQQHFVQNNP